MSDDPTIAWLQTWIRTPSHQLPPNRSHTIQTLRNHSELTTHHYHTALNSTINDIAVTHSQIYHHATLLHDDGFTRTGLLWADVRRIFAWEELLSWPFDQQTLQEWRQSIVEAAVHVQHARFVLTRLDRVVEQARREERREGWSWADVVRGGKKDPLMVGL